MIEKVSAVWTWLYRLPCSPAHCPMHAYRVVYVAPRVSSSASIRYSGAEMDLCTGTRGLSRDEITRETRTTSLFVRSIDRSIDRFESRCVRALYLGQDELPCLRGQTEPDALVAQSFIHSQVSAKRAHVPMSTWRYVCRQGGCVGGCCGTTTTPFANSGGTRICSPNWGEKSLRWEIGCNRKIWDPRERTRISVTGTNAVSSILQDDE